MGKIVSAAATSHTFGVADGVEAQAQRIFDGIDRIGQAIQASRPTERKEAFCADFPGGV